MKLIFIQKIDFFFIFFNQISIEFCRKKKKKMLVRSQKNVFSVCLSLIPDIFSQILRSENKKCIINTTDPCVEEIDKLIN